MEYNLRPLDALVQVWVSLLRGEGPQPRSPIVRVRSR